MRPRSLAVLLAVLLTAGAAAPVAGGAAEVNYQVCPVCGPAFETVAADGGVNVSVVESVASVQIHRDGSAHWTVRNRLANESNARRLADADLEAALDEQFDTHFRLDSDRIRNVSTRVEGDTVVVEFTDVAAGSREFGLTVVTYFRVEAHVEQSLSGADRLTVVGPDGTSLVDAGPVGHEVVDARVEDGGRRVVWSNATAEGDAPHVHALLTFGRYTGPGNAFRTDLALLAAQDYGPLVWRLVLPFNVFGALVFVPAGFVFALAVVLARLSPGDGPAGERRAMGLGALALVLLLVPSLPEFLAGGPVIALQSLGATYGVLALVLLARERGVVSPGRRGVLAALAAPPLAALGWALFAGLDGLVLALWLASVGATYGLGAARTRRESLVAGCVAAASLYAAIAAFGLQLELYGGGIGGIGLLLVPVTALGASVGAAVLYPFGATFDGVAGSEDVSAGGEA